MSKVVANQIATLVTRVFSPEPAAAALRLAGLAKALTKRGFDVDVLTTHFQQTLRREQDGKMRVTRLPALRDKTGAVRGYVPYMSFDIPALFRMLMTRRPGVFICEPPPTTGVVTRMAAALRRVPYVYYAADIVSDAAVAGGVHPLVCKAVRLLEKTAMRGARHVIAVTPTVARRCEALGAKSVSVVPNGVDVSEFVTTRNAPRTELEDHRPVFLYAGTVADWLGPEIFIDAFAEVRADYPQALLVFLGQGTAWQKLQDYAREQNVPAKFYDAVSTKEAKSWYSWADVALASIKPGEYTYAYPTKVLAALSQGTPVIYAGGGPVVDDIVSADLGKAVPFEKEAVASAMLALAKTATHRSSKERDRLRNWVCESRSLEVSSAAAADVVMRVAQQNS